MDAILGELGYDLEDDAWDVHGRRTYSHEADATAAYLRALIMLLRPYGFRLDPQRLRTLVSDTGEIIELEPGGFDCPGHLLHHMKCEPAE